MPETLSPRDLSPGQHVLEAYDEDRNLLVRDFWVENDEDIERLGELGVHRVTVETGTSSGRAEPTNQRAPTPEELESDLEEAPHRLRETERLYRHTVTKIKDVFFSADRGEDIEPEELDPFLEKALRYAEDSPGSIAVLTQIEDYDFDTFRHSVNMGILAILYGQHCDYDRGEIRDLALGAMLHDIGKIRIPEEIILKEDELDEEEYEVVKTHTTRGYEMLLDLGMGKPITNIALEHHEHPDGSGYPEGTDQIHPYSRVISVLDVYDAMTSQRVYSDEVQPNRAFSVLRTEFGQHSETRSILYDLLRCLGLYPVGSLVQLSSGELAFVQKNHPKDLKHPVVCVVVDSEGRSLEQPFLLDLKRLRNHKVMKNNQFYDHETTIEQMMSLEEIPMLDDETMLDVFGEIGL